MGSGLRILLTLAMLIGMLPGTMPKASALYDENLIWQIGKQDGSNAEFSENAPMEYTVPENWNDLSIEEGFKDFPTSLDNDTLTITWTQDAPQSANLVIFSYNPGDFGDKTRAIPWKFTVKLNGEELWDNQPWYSSVRLYLPLAYQKSGENTIEISGKIDFDAINLNRETFDHKPLTAMYYLQEWPNDFNSLYDIVYNVQNNVDYGYLFNWIDGWESYCWWTGLEPEEGNYNLDNSNSFYAHILREADELFQGEGKDQRKIFLHNGLIPEWQVGTSWPMQHDMTNPEAATRFYEWLLLDEVNSDGVPGVGIGKYMMHSETIGESGLTWAGSNAGLVELYTRYNDAVKKANSEIWTTGYPRCAQILWALDNCPEKLASTDGCGWHYRGQTSAEPFMRYQLDKRGGSRFTLVEDEGNEAHFPELSTWCEYQVADLNMVGPGYGVSDQGWCSNGPANPETLQINPEYAEQYKAVMMWSNINHFSNRTFAAAQYGGPGRTHEMWIGSSAKDGMANAVLYNRTGSAQNADVFIPVPAAGEWDVRTYKYNGPGLPLLEIDRKELTVENNEIALSDIPIEDGEYRVFKCVPKDRVDQEINTGLEQVVMETSSRNLQLDESVQLVLTGYNGDGTLADLSGAEITYTSDNPDAISVDSDGVVTAMVDGGKPAIVRATVKLDGKTVDSNGLRIYPAQKLQPQAASTNNGQNADRAHDGNLGTYWTYGTGTENEYIQYDFGETQSISRVRYNYNLLDSPSAPGIVANNRVQFRQAVIKVSDDPEFKDYTIAMVMSFVDDFETEKDWQPKSGTWTMEGGVYRQTDGSAANAYSFQDCITPGGFTDYTFEANVTLDSGETAGMAYRVQDENNFYLVKLSDSQAQLVKVADGAETILATQALETSLGTSEHFVRIVTERTGTRVYLDKQPKAILDVEDDSFDHGGVALYTNNAQATFDNVNVQLFHEEKNSTDVIFPAVSGRYIRVEPTVYSGNNRFGELEVFGSGNAVTKYNITVEETSNGTVTADRTQAAEGEMVTLTISPAEGYRLIPGTLKANDKVVSGNTFAMPNGDVTVTAQFGSAAIHDITVGQMTNGTVSVNLTKASEGDVIKLTVKPDKTFTMPAEAVTITAEFEEIPAQTYAITVADMTNGTVTADKAEAAEGETVTLTVTPNEGYRLVAGSLKANDAVVEGNTFIMPAEAVTITAAFEKEESEVIWTGPKYVITVRQSVGGSIDPSTCVVNEGDSKTFTIQAEEGYEIVDVLVDDESVGVCESYTFQNVSEKHTITAKFQLEDATEEIPHLNFTDVDESDWFYHDVAYAVEKGLMEGTGNGRFQPEAGTTRGMIAAILYREAGSPEVESDGAYWYSDARAWAMETGISDGTNMDGLITREQLAAMLYRYATYKQQDVSARGDLTAFADSASVSGWATEGMSWAVGEGILSGKNGGKLDPQAGATRAETAAMLARFCELSK